ncbi:probable ATP-dependent RNA helicase ddx17 [Teleopsis dalmanni]|uniref:probable ATP-dependent RNA helicase ddx17 n=1 Tax=Teleopsis dalmanni TaxID=139649 RepID=UPI0018CCA1A7|nr:probable ATP-dependent RNA helicase ddx17 [Teleopsis dalmanni]
MKKRSALFNHGRLLSPHKTNRSCVQKDVYWETEEIRTWSPLLVEQYLALNYIRASRLLQLEDVAFDKIPKPIQRFAHIFDHGILSKLFQLGYQYPTPIQKQTVPVMLKGENVIGISPTGSGKTIAYFIASILHIKAQRKLRCKNGPYVLVISSTKKRVLKIADVYKKFDLCTNPTCILSDNKKCINIAKIKSDCIISTPDHIYDFIIDRRINMSSFSFIILDNADDMWYNGFEKQIHNILYYLHPLSQFVVMSVTFPSYLQSIAEKYMYHPIIIENAPPVVDPKLGPFVKQHFKFAYTDADKYQMFYNFAKGLKPREAVLVYCLDKARAVDLSSTLATKSLATQCVQSLITQYDHDITEMYIKHGDIKILCDFEGSGKEFPVSYFRYFFHFDQPSNIYYYKKRVNQAMNARQDCTFISFISPTDGIIVKQLYYFLSDNKQAIPDAIREVLTKPKVNRNGK